MSEIKDKLNSSPAVKSFKKRILLQAMIAVASVALIAVLMFSMTAAWYTNVAKTSSMTFKAESWGFDSENITVSSEAIAITPGTKGVIPLTVDNSTGEESVRIRVNLSKVSSDETETQQRNLELEKRIYFYADAAKTFEFGEGEEKTTETVSKVYIGASETDSYSYTILPGNILSLSEEYYNDTPIYWEWVYDMLGYYFYGTVDEAAVITEYIRPIEYDYDEAVFDTDESSENYGQLVSIGDKTKAEFLAELSGADGYEGAINLEDATYSQKIKVIGEGTSKKIYYPVQVDEEGYGVWAYLATFSEIEEAIIYDSQLAGSDTSITVTMKITAFNVDTETKSVTSVAELNTALKDANLDVIKLENGLALTEPLTVDSTVDSVLDLNGFALTYTGTEDAYNLIRATEGSSLTIMNGDLVGNGKGSDAENRASMATMAIQTTAANVTLNNVNISGFDGAVKVSDENNTAGDTYLQIIDCNFETIGNTIFVKGNGTSTSGMTRVLIQDSTLVSTEYMVLTGNGTASGTGRWGTDIVVKGSTLTGYNAAIYQPQQQSTMYIEDSIITGNTGICVKGGKLTVKNSTVTGTGAVEVEEPGSNASGFADTGDGIYVDAGYNWSVSVDLEGDNNLITSDKAYAVDLFGYEDKGPGTVGINAGTYTGAKGSCNFNGIGSFEIYDGNFTNAVSEKITRYDQN